MYQLYVINEDSGIETPIGPIMNADDASAWYWIAKAKGIDIRWELLG